MIRWSHIDREWITVDIEVDIRWRRLRGRFVCAVRGHADTNEFGDCKRCGVDVLHLPWVERQLIAQRLINAHIRQHIEFARKAFGDREF